MSRDVINQTRYSTLRAALVLVGGVALGGTLIVLQLPVVHPAEWVAFLLVGLAAFTLLPAASRARAASDRAALQRIAYTLIGLATLLLLQRLAWSLYGPILRDGGGDVFRPTFAFLPFLYLGALAVMPARVALRFCWVTWGVVLLLTLPALPLRVGMDLSHAGVPALLLWLLLANPLFILMMQALPRYEEQLVRTTAEVEEMRSRTELMDQLAESERRFNLVVDSLQVGVWDRWIGPPVRRWWSPRFFELLGYAPGELTPSDGLLEELLHPDDRERVWRAGAEQLQAGDIFDLDFRMRTQHRGYRWFNSHAKADRDANGRILRLAGSITDIHDQRIAEDALRSAQAELTRLAYRDTLTDLYNRRYFDEHFRREWERARRSGQPLSLMIIDLDHFKAFNDRYGHPAGDGCLIEVAKLLTRCANRPADTVARLGGEEFGIVLPETHGAGARDVAVRMQQVLEAAGIRHDASPTGRVTMSIGIASLEQAGGPGPAELFEHADKALYDVKHRGRNGILRYGVSDSGAALSPAA